MARNLSFSVLLGLILLVCGSSVRAQQSSVGSGWVEHKDPLGFDVQYPQGWGVTATDEGRIVVHSADKSIFAVVQPFLLKQPMRSEEWIDSALGEMKTLFPEVAVQQKKSFNTKPDEVAASAGYTANGKPGQANVLCSIMGSSGMFFAIAAPQDLFAAKKTTLLKVLRSFHFIQPTAKVGAGSKTMNAGNPDADIRYVKFTDPKENAFTEEVPKGWSTQGGLTRISSVDARNQVNTVSPDGSMHLQVGDTGIGQFQLPTPNVAEFHRRFPNVPLPPGEGQTITLPTGMSFLIMRYQNGAEFSRDVVQSKCAKQHSGLQVIDTKEFNPPANQQLSAGNPITAGATTFSYQENGKEMSGFVYTSTRLMPFPNNSGGTWYCGQILIATFPKESNGWTKAMTILEHISNSQTFDPQWFQRQYNVMLSTTHAYIASVQQQMKASHEAFMKQMAEQSEKNREVIQARLDAKDDTTRRWKNVILGTTDVVDPQTGKTGKIANGHNYYWTNGSVVVGTDINQRPDINFTPLEQW